MQLSDLDSIRPVYLLPRQPFVEEVLQPCLRLASSLDCMFGFFSSDSIRQIAPGLAEFLARAENPMRLIVSPNISEDDVRALVDGVTTPLAVLEGRLRELIGQGKISSSALVHHTLKCLAYLLGAGRLEMRVALVAGGLFHPKVWIMRSGTETLVAHGSSNLTGAGLSRNHEQIRVERSWASQESEQVVNSLTEEFAALWDGQHRDTLTVPLPVAVKDSLLQEFGTKTAQSSDKAPTSRDYQDACVKDRDAEAIRAAELRPCPELTPPNELRIFDGAFAHQGKAIEAWEASSRRGILAMATGSGKTITALVAAARLQQIARPLLVIISAPYKPLIAQWEEEVNAFRIKPLALTALASNRDRAGRIDLAVQQLSAGLAQIHVAVITNDFLTTDTFRAVLASVPAKVSAFLIADEVHNLGSPSFISSPPERFQYRLGLSATPRRQYDPDGTTALFKYFGPVVFEYTLRDAIGTCLVRYNYNLHPVDLTDDEFGEWQELTRRLRLAGFAGDADVDDSGGLPSEVERLLFRRRAVIELASNKLAALRDQLKHKGNNRVRHTLIYTSDKGPRQLEEVNAMLQDDLGMIIHQLTAEETARPRDAAAILDRFARGEFQAITCKRVLDEGVNIPQVVEAHLLASNTVERQWIQRRGRILRKCDAVNKRLAHLHDYLVVPPDPKGEGKAILRGELARAREFASLADNAGDSDGPVATMQAIKG